MTQLCVHADEAALVAALQRQPVSVAVNAHFKGFMNYKAGVLDTDECDDTVDHAVLAVGYGVEDGKKYVTSWLIDGHLRSGTKCTPAQTQAKAVCL